MKELMKVAQWLCAIGALNWGLVVLNFNLVAFIDNLLGATGIISMLVYALVGFSGLLVILNLLGMVKLK